MNDPVTLSAGAMLLRVVLALGLVLGLLAAVLYLYRRASQRGRGGQRGERIQLIAQRSLGPRRSLALIEVAGETLLIGITPQQISALRRLAPRPGSPREAAAAQPASPESPALEAPFEATLQSEVHRVGRHLAAVLGGAGGEREAAGRGDA